MACKFTELIVDCQEPPKLARFWAAVLGWSIEPEEGDDVQVNAPAGDAPALLFLRVPERKVVKNRLHIDVNPVNCDQQQEVERILALGARHVDVGQGEQTWVVLADPEGNEFCVLRDRLAT